MRKIVTIGGGTGTFVVLSGLRRLPGVSLTAIVSAADDGGSTGHLRDAYGFLPAGDARQALVALAEDGSILRDLFAYRFTKSDVAGHNLGNLFITALEDLLGSGVKALEEASRVLRIEGRVIPATQTGATLAARFEDGTEEVGQCAIELATDIHGRIKELSLTEPMPLTPPAVAAIKEADLIVLGPGSLYTSTIAALLPEGMQSALAASTATLVYVSNLFTNKGETDGYRASEHVAEAERYAGRTFDRVFMHAGTFAPEVRAWYAKEREYPVVDDMEHDPRVTRLPLASAVAVRPVAHDPIRRSLIRHDPEKIAAAIATALP